MADIVNILTLVLKAMVSVECLIKLSGDDKKRFVITLLEKQLPNYDEYREIVPNINYRVSYYFVKNKNPNQY